jgi:hypothetical protein
MLYYFGKHFFARSFQAVKRLPPKLGVRRNRFRAFRVADHESGIRLSNRLGIRTRNVEKDLIRTNIKYWLLNMFSEVFWIREDIEGQVREWRKKKRLKEEEENEERGREWRREGEVI